MKKRIRQFIILGLSGIFFLGCARTATLIGTVGAQITLQVNYRGELKSDNRYFIVFGTTAAPEIPFIPNEMVQPGDAVQDTQVDYFTKFYSSWSDYVLVQGLSAKLVPGFFTRTGTPEAQGLFDISRPANNSFSVRFALNRLRSGNTIPDKLFVDIVSVSSTNRVADNLSFNNFGTGTISTLVVKTDQGTNQQGQDSDAENGVSDLSLDILDYTISVQ